MIEKQLEALLKDIKAKSKKIEWTLKSFETEDKRTNMIARLTKELNMMVKLLQEWQRKAYNIDRTIKDNPTASLVSASEDVRKRGQQHYRQKKKEK